MTTISFQVGTTYKGRFICDYDTVFTRTDKTVWLQDTQGKVA